tara:strand:+ start:1474 stop:1884 length:411 start_codon:yes stop_codon:yes gene_type:complete
MNRLPIELQNNIWIHYWQYKYNDVVNEIKKPLIIENKAKKYFNNYFNVLNGSYKNNYKYYFKNINNEIKYMVNNKGFNMICYHSNLFMKHININYLNNIFRKVPEDYKYIAALSVLISGCHRYHVLLSFENINNFT